MSGVSNRVYVGNLSMNAREREVDDEFSRYGRISRLDVKNGFAFLEYDEKRDAEDAVRSMDGADFLGRRIRVEFARGPRADRARLDRDRAPNRSEYRCLLFDIPNRMSWQDLKDVMRSVGEVVFTDVSRDERGNPMGVVEFRSPDDVRYAIRKLDGTDMDGRRIRVTPDEPPRRSRDRYSPYGGSRSRRRSRSRSRSRSRDRGRREKDKKRRHTPSPSPSPSPDRERSRSRTVSRSRSRSASGSASPARSRSPSPAKRAGSESRSPSPDARSRPRSSSRSRSSTPS